MKRMIISALFVLMILVLILGHSKPLWADTKNMGAEFLVEQAESFVKQGRIEEAIHEYSKALMLNPDNKKAKKFLEEHGLKSNHYDAYRGVMSKESQIKEMASHIKEYTKKIDKLEAQRADLEERLSRLQSEHDDLTDAHATKKIEVSVLQDKLFEIAERSQKRRQKHISEIEQIKDFYSEKSDQLEVIVDQQKQDLIDQQIALGEQGSESGLYELKYTQLLMESLDNEDQLAALSAQNNLLRDDLFQRRKENISTFAILEDYLYVRRNELDDINDQLVYKEMDLTTHEEILIARLDELITLHENVGRQLDELSEREDIIDEKNKDIEFLQSEYFNLEKKLNTLQNK